MISTPTFFVGTGPLPESSMKAGSLALTRFWGCQLITASCDQEPNKVIKSLQNKTVIVELVGDAAVSGFPEGSWLEALSAWKLPVVLITMPLPSGKLTGASNAYVALCRQLSVPLIGLLQFGGDWDQYQRKLDGLPWCGFIPSEVINTNNEIEHNLSFSNDIESIVYILKMRKMLLIS
ncbi:MULTISPECIES: hypothetical protein [Prochlorococcus]|uniref:hypothetical protein n=1 Tax=Prochlorococcus TaxID=1218 RepID=UPI0005338FC0|nr:MULTISPECIES: hypothetical protein [Prochlorococcus]KGG12241.1 hypothetical protein EV05_1450 [Prochlorococcus sp. MIT 0601]